MLDDVFLQKVLIIYTFNHDHPKMYSKTHHVCKYFSISFKIFISHCDADSVRTQLSKNARGK